MSLLPHLHHINILIHVVFGSLAIFGGFLLLARRKGDRTHRLTGHLTLVLAGISLTTAFIGAFVFRGKLDLLGVTVLVAYHLWAGLRALHLKARGRTIADSVPALLLFIGGLTLLCLYHTGGAVNWGPAKVYAAAGALIAFGGYDVLRMTFPIGWRNWLNPAEHAFRMTCLVGALISVASGTILHGAYAALVPSGVFTGVALLFAVRAANRARR